MLIMSLDKLIEKIQESELSNETKDVFSTKDPNKIIDYLMEFERDRKESALDLLIPNFYNRKFFLKRGQEEIERSIRYNHSIMILYLDLDGFKQINDTYGHQIGDKVLIETGNRIKKIIRKTDIPSRIGGDEFAILIPEINEFKDYRKLPEKIINEINEPINIEGKICRVGTSIGVFEYNGNDKHNQYPDFSQFLNMADEAMYLVKKLTKNNFITRFGVCNNITEGFTTLPKGIELYVRKN